LPRGGEEDLACSAGRSRVQRIPPAGGLRGLRAMDVPLSGAVSHGLQPAGMGDGSSLCVPGGDARARGARGRGPAGSARARRDRPHLHLPAAGLRSALGRGSYRHEGPRPTGPLTSMETIVVGVDGSEGGASALEFAAGEAAFRGARLRIVSAWQVPAVAYGGHFGPPLDATTWD